MEHEIIQGKRGGCYWLDENGKKHYVKSTTSKPKSTSETKTTKTKKVVENKVSRYICYYTVRDKNGEMIDDFKEWCDAYSEWEARQEFRDRYPDNERYEISMVAKE